MKLITVVIIVIIKTRFVHFDVLMIIIDTYIYIYIFVYIIRSN